MPNSANAQCAVTPRLPIQRFSELLDGIGEINSANGSMSWYLQSPRGQQRTEHHMKTRSKKGMGRGTIGHYVNSSCVALLQGAAP